MEEPQIDKRLCIKYLEFLSQTAEDLLAKESTLLPDDMQGFSNEIQLFRRRVDESPLVGEKFKQDVRRISADPNLTGHSTREKLGEAIETLQGGPHLNDRTSYGPLGMSIVQSIRTYRDEIENLLETIETFQFFK